MVESYYLTAYIKYYCRKIKYKSMINLTSVPCTPLHNYSTLKLKERLKELVQLAYLKMADICTASGKSYFVNQTIVIPTKTF